MAQSKIFLQKLGATFPSIIMIKNIAAIANGMLSTKAKTAVNTWLGAGVNIVQVSIQADVYKHGAGEWSSSTHFANVPRKLAFCYGIGTIAGSLFQGTHPSLPCKMVARTTALSEQSKITRRF